MSHIRRSIEDARSGSSQNQQQVLPLFVHSMHASCVSVAPARHSQVVLTRSCAFLFVGVLLLLLSGAICGAPPVGSYTNERRHGRATHGPSASFEPWRSLR